ncbi:glutamine amidotransferase-related protein [Sphingobacterium sp. LRF_L2]|uniref:glutamine amidotransferase-related protein n=1 Tax=Sphingobacterium sp. LRF_L2 TaxID=3369421 RepID=UPI003F610CD3
MHIHFIQHESFEAPGAYLIWAMKRDYSVSFTRIFEYDLLPPTVDNIDLLIVMGGPQSPASTKEEFPYFDADAEAAFIRSCIDAGKAVLGVCLGAQLIGMAKGGDYKASPQREIGVFPIYLTDKGKEDWHMGGFSSPLLVGHWHNDMPGLVDGSDVLAESEGCPRQIVRYSKLVYGFQCHMELTPELVELLITSEEDLEESSKQHAFVQAPDSIRTFDYSQMNDILYLFLDRLVESYNNSH